MSFFSHVHVLAIINDIKMLHLVYCQHDQASSARTPKTGSLKCMNNFLIGCYRQLDWYLNSTNFFMKSDCLGGRPKQDSHLELRQKISSLLIKNPTTSKLAMLQTHSMIRCFHASHKS